MTYRKSALRFIAGVLTYALILTTSAGLMAAKGCTAAQTQQTTADLLIVAGNSVAAYYTSIGDTVDADKATTFAQTVAADAASFTAGTKSQVAIQLIQDFEGILSIDKPTGNGAFLIDLALSTAESALQVIEANTGAVAPPATPAVTARIASAQTVAIQNPPKSAKDYKTRWNALLKANPVPGLNPLK